MMDFLSSDFLFRNAILGGLVIAVVCSSLGVYMVLRRLVLLSVALPQAGAAGVAAVFLLTRHSHVGEASAGHFLAMGGSLLATLAMANAATYLFVSLDPKGDLEMSNLLRGELLAIGDAELAVLSGAAVLTLGLFVLFRREILLASFDPEFDRTLGRRPERADALLYLLLGGTIALGVMNVGPLVVFGFLVLPPLAALRVAPGLGVAFLLSALVAAFSSLGGFLLALRADLPAGPTSVAVAAAFWALFGIYARLRAGGRPRAAPVAALLLILLLPGCAGLNGASRDPAPLEPGTLPALDPARRVAVLPFRNETGEPLVLGSANPLKDVGRALGDPFAAEPARVTDVLQQMAVSELERRGVAVLPPNWMDSPGNPPADAASAARLARRAGLEGPMLLGTLRRFTLTRNRLLLVRLELELVDPADVRVLWRGEARHPVPVPGALTLREVVIDAGPEIFAEAFGSS
jgi:ABC-type Mn2+/Zn2+ transport system permease subunit